jgi:hypothetical protein
MRYCRFCRYEKPMSSQDYTDDDDTFFGSRIEPSRLGSIAGDSFVQRIEV